jgi:hypothetical protein
MRTSAVEAAINTWTSYAQTRDLGPSEKDAQPATGSSTRSTQQPVPSEVIAGEEAEKLGLDVRAMKVDWTVKPTAPAWAIRCHHGRPYDMLAGGQRNDAMLDERPDLVLAFHDDLDGESRGTKDCVGQAKRAGIPIEIHTHQGVTNVGQPALF